jgi:NTE family protein
MNIRPEQLIPDMYPTLMEMLEKGSISDYKKFLKEIRLTFTDRGLDLSQFKKTLFDFIDEEKIRASKVDFGLVTYSLTDLKAIEVMINDIPDGLLHEHLIASSYLPGFKREKLSGKSYLDGAFHDNLPLNLLASNGYKNLIAIELLGIGFKQKLKEKEVNVIRIRPSDNTGHVVDFKEGLNINNIKMGYYDTLRVFRNYYGRQYYLEDLWSPKMAYKFIDNLTEEQVEGLAEMLNIKRIPYKRCVYERIIPKLMELLDIPDECDYNMILLYILEYLGKTLGIDRYQLLTFDGFMRAIADALHDASTEEINWSESVVKLLKTTKLYTHTFKDKVLIGCAQIIITGTKNGGRDGL